VALEALFNLAHTWRYPIPFLKDRAISAGGRQFCPIIATKLFAMATSLEELEKNKPDQENSCKYLPFGEKMVKISPVDTEIALLRVKKKKKEEITEGKIYSTSSKFAE